MVDAVYYVRDDGTATGDGGRYATPKTATDNWATAFSATSEYYGSVEDAYAATTTPVVGDEIRASNVHDFTAVSSRSYGLATASPVPVISVDDNNVGQSLRGAKESATGASNDVIVNGNALLATFYGFDFSSDDNLQCFGSGAGFLLFDCNVTLTGSGDQLSCTGDGAYMEINDGIVTWTNGTTAGMLLTNNGAMQVHNNVSYVATANTLDDFIQGGGTGGGATIELNECDVSAVTGWMVGQFGASATDDDNFIMNMRRCKMNANKQFVEEQFASPGHHFFAENCSAVASEAEYQIHAEKFSGSIEDQDSTGIVRVESEPLDGGEQVSFKIITSANAGLGSPLRFDLSAIFADLTAAGSNEITIYIAVANTVTLTDTNFWINLSHPDATNKQTWTVVTSRNSDIIATGTELTDDSASSNWEDNGVDLTGHNEYRIVLASSSGAASVPRVEIFTTVASETIYVGTDIGLS